MMSGNPLTNPEGQNSFLSSSSNNGLVHDENAILDRKDKISSNSMAANALIAQEDKISFQAMFMSMKAI